MRIRKFGLLLALVGVCLLLLTLQSRGYGARASDFVAVVTTPLQAGYARVTGGALVVWTTYLDWKTVRAENRRLLHNQRAPDPEEMAGGPANLMSRGRGLIVPIVVSLPGGGPSGTSGAPADSSPTQPTHTMAPDMTKMPGMEPMPGMDH